MRRVTADLRTALEALGMTLNSVLSGAMSNEDAASNVVERYSDFENQLNPSSPEGKFFKRLYWSLVLLDEPEPYRTKREELEYLRDCLKHPRWYDENKANAPYSK